MLSAYSDGRSLVAQPPQPMAVYHNRTFSSRNREGSRRLHRNFAFAENASLAASSTDARGRTKWYGNYTEEQYLAQRQSEERAKWAASVRSLTSDLNQSTWSASPLHPPGLLAGLTVVLMSPRKPVTVGTVARACGSFECEDLRIVMPRQQSYITRHAKSASKGAQYILYGAGMYDSIEQATSDCDIRIAFTRWSQASGPHVAKLDITSLTSHPAVQALISQPLAATSQPLSPPRPPSAPWLESTATAAAEAEARLMAATAELTAAASSSAAATAGRNSDDEMSAGEEGSGDSSSSGQQGHEGSSRNYSSATVTTAGTSTTSTASSNNSAGHLKLRGGGGVDEAALSDYTAGSRKSDVSSDGQQPGVATTSAAPPAARPPKVALVFGREELGLSDNEVDGCEAVCCVPMGRLQESLSLSHAVSIALCAIYQARLQHLASSGTHVGLETAGSGRTHACS